MRTRQQSKKTQPVLQAPKEIVKKTTIKKTITKSPPKTTTTNRRKTKQPEEGLPEQYTKVRNPNHTPANMRGKSKQTIITLEDAYDYIDAENIGQTSKDIYKERLRLLCEHFKTNDLNELLSNPKEVFNAIKQMTYKNDKSKLLSEETHKLILTAIRVITQRGAVKSVGKEEQKQYEKEMLDIAKLTELKRGELDRKAGLKANPNVDWDLVVNEVKKFEDERYMTVKQLRLLLLVKFYVAMPPRRLDYRFLKLRSKMPDPHPQGESYVVVRDFSGNVTMVIDEFKTRHRENRDLLPTFKKTLPNSLAEYIKSYVKKAKLVDGDYLFFNKEPKEGYSDNRFSTVIKSASKKVIGYNLSVNDYRHLFVNFITEHITKYNDNQLQQIAYDMADKSVYTNLKYRLAEQANKGKSIKEINDEEIQRREQERQRLLEAEEVMSVMGGGVANTDFGDMVEDDEEENDSGYVSNRRRATTYTDSEATIPLNISKNEDLVIAKKVDKLLMLLKPIIIKFLSTSS